MAAMMIEDRKRVTAGGAGFQRHITLIAEIDLIARCIGNRIQPLEIFKTLHAAVAGEPKK
jgi:hypothetical protein